MINLTCQYKLKLNKQQENEIDQILDVCKSVYNYALRERKDWYASRKSPINCCSIIKEYIIPAAIPYPDYNNQSSKLTEAKKTNPRLKSVHSQVLQQTLKTLDKAIADMKARGFGFPRFKKKMRSFVFPAMLKNCLGNNRIKLPSLGWLGIRQSRPFPTGFEAKQARIVKKASGYFVMIVFQSQEQCPEAPVGKTFLGIDAGIESFVAHSQGELIKAPKFLLEVQRQLKLLQRRLKGKKKGSNNWLKLQKRIAKLHETVANARKDWHFRSGFKDFLDLQDYHLARTRRFWSRGDY